MTTSCVTNLDRGPDSLNLKTSQQRRERRDRRKLRQSDECGPNAYALREGEAIPLTRRHSAHSLFDAGEAKQTMSLTVPVSSTTRLWQPGSEWRAVELHASCLGA